MYRNAKLETQAVCRHSFLPPSEAGGPVTCEKCNLAIPCPHPEWTVVEVKSAAAGVPREYHNCLRLGAVPLNNCDRRTGGDGNRARQTQTPRR